MLTLARLSPLAGGPEMSRQVAWSVARGTVIDNKQA